MDSHDLMKLLIPEGKVKDVAQFTGLTSSLLYQERRKSGKDLSDTGTRNTIDRLDLFCEWNLDRNPEIVRIVGERYLQMYERHVSPCPENVTVNDLLSILGDASRECGEAISALAQRQKLGTCTIEIAQAKQALEKALRLVACLEEQANS